MSPPENKTSPLAAPVTSLWGVGGERAAQLARLEILTIEDLLLHRPRRYEDRRHFRKIAELTKDEAVHGARHDCRAGTETFSRRQQIRF
jgi:ATP-dependent DNA helicase RecG